MKTTLTMDETKSVLEITGYKNYVGDADKCWMIQPRTMMLAELMPSEQGIAGHLECVTFLHMVEIGLRFYKSFGLDDSRACALAIEKLKELGVTQAHGIAA